jgi:hypothetical protein
MLILLRKLRLSVRRVANSSARENLWVECSSVGGRGGLRASEGRWMAGPITASLIWVPPCTTPTPCCRYSHHYIRVHSGCGENRASLLVPLLIARLLRYSGIMFSDWIACVPFDKFWHGWRAVRHNDSFIYILSFLEVLSSAMWRRVVGQKFILLSYFRLFLYHPYISFYFLFLTLFYWRLLLISFVRLFLFLHFFFPILYPVSIYSFPPLFALYVFPSFLFLLGPFIFFCIIFFLLVFLLSFLP